MISENEIIELFDLLDNDTLGFINSLSCYNFKNNKELRIAKNLWFKDKDKCILKYGHISFWETSNIDDIESLFKKKNYFYEILLWNVTRVYNMSETFAKSFFRGDISYWKTTKLMYFDYAFYPKDD